MPRPLQTLLLGVAACGVADVHPASPETVPTVPASVPSTGDTAAPSVVATPDCTTGGPDMVLGDAGVELHGSEPYGRVGNAMVSLGDVTGDGLADVLIGSDHANAVYLLAGDPDLAAGPIDGGAWLVIDGLADQALGSSLSVAGDVDGDGRLDVWIGDRAMGQGRGGAYLVLAADLGPGRVSVTEVSEASVIGDSEGRATAKVVGLGDLTGDGVADVALTSDVYAERRGIVHILGGPFVGEHSTAEAFASFVGTAPGDELFRVLAPGDLDDDGHDDLLLFATGAAGASGVAYGLSGPLAGGRVEADQLRDRWTGETGGLMGKSAAVVDLEQDGVSEVLVGSPYAEGKRGHAYLLRGLPTGEIPIADAAEGSWVGVAADDRVGFAVASAGDTDGDGVAEVMVAAKGVSETASEGGAIYLLSGGPVGRVPLDEGSYGLRVTGESPWEFLGKPVAAGDVDGDGGPDLLLGSKNRDGGGTDAGAVIVRSCASRAR